MNIGFIYEFDEPQNKGILCWGDNSHMFFSLSRIRRDLRSKQLVCFELNDQKQLLNIEPVSLINFKTKYSKYINDIHPFGTTGGNSCSSNSAFIKYYLEDDVDDFLISLGIIEGEHTIEKTYERFCSNRFLLSEQQVNIKNFDYWVSKEIAEDPLCYGKTLQEFLDLFELFEVNDDLELRKNRNDDSSWIKSISSSWRYLLDKLKEEDLISVIKVYPILQFLMPVEFCMNHLDLLNHKFSFPNTDICMAYYEAEILHAKTAWGYEWIMKKLNEADLYKSSREGTEHNHTDNQSKKRVDISINVLSSDNLHYLRELLHQQLFSSIIPHIKHVINEFTHDTVNGEALINELISINDEKSIIDIGIFCDWMTYSSLDISVCCFNDSIETMQDKFKTLFSPFIIEKSKECLILNALSEDITIDRMVYIASCLKEWIDQETIVKVRELCEIKMLSSEDLNDLTKAYYLELLSKDNYSRRFESLINSYSVDDLFQRLQNHSNDYPVFIQEIILNKAISLFRSSSEYIQIYELQNHDLPSLINWLRDNIESEWSGGINQELVNKTISKLIPLLDKKERWDLFEKGIIDSPSDEDIRDMLNDDYSGDKKKDEKYLSRKCFQDMMLEDIYKTFDYQNICIIIDRLDNEHQTKLKETGSDFIRFLLWVHHPTKDIDRDLLSSNFPSLNKKDQFRVFRYMFLLKEENNFDLNLNQLYKLLKSSGKSIDPSLEIIFLLLEKSLSNSLGDVSSKDIHVFFANDADITEELSNIQSFFYNCPGRLSVSSNSPNDPEYFGTNGKVERETVDGKDYFVVSFYPSPIDIYGQPFEFLDWTYIEPMVEKFELNCPYIKKDEKYYVPTEYEYEVRQFMRLFYLDDDCKLFPDGQTYIPLYTHNNHNTSDKIHLVCKCTNCKGISIDNKIPFYWCEGKPCARLGRYFNPVSSWAQFRFGDFLRILSGGLLSQQEIWKIVKEVSIFINELSEDIGTHNIAIHEVSDEAEKGCWMGEETVVSDEPEEEYEDEKGYGFEERDYTNHYDEPTYDRYNGSYAQDEMGYSDDDIDTIFDGDPDAYWNID